jgi:hypothetical protein
MTYGLNVVSSEQGNGLSVENKVENLHYLSLISQNTFLGYLSRIGYISVLHYFLVPCFGSEVFVSLFFAPFFDFPLVDVDLTLAGSTGSKVNI